MKIITLLALFISPIAFSHFEIGTYEGTNNFGLKCSIDFVSKVFFPNVKNPLNERVAVKVQKIGAMVVGHQAQINSNTKSVTADKTRLTGSLGLPDSAIALEIKVSDEGPSEYNIIIHNWKKDKALMYTCGELVFKNPDLFN